MRGSAITIDENVFGGINKFVRNWTAIIVCGFGSGGKPSIATVQKIVFKGGGGIIASLQGYFARRDRPERSERADHQSSL